MGTKELSLDKFEEAYEIVKEVASETKLVYSDYFSAQTGNKIYLKPENMQLTGAYKLRGAYYKISTLTPEEREKGLITASAGNHAQGVAYAAKCYGVKAVIVMPTTTPLIKVNRTKGYGAEVVLYGDVYDEACAHAYELAKEQGNLCSLLSKSLTTELYHLCLPSLFFFKDFLKKILCVHLCISVHMYVQVSFKTRRGHHLL